MTDTTIGNISPQEQLKDKLSEIDIKTKEKLAEENASQFGFNYINLLGFPISPETLGMILEEEAIKIRALAFFKDDQTIKLASPDPNRPEVQELIGKLEKKYRKKIDIYIVSEHSFSEAMKLYKSVVKIRAVSHGVNITEADLKKYQKEIASFKELNEKLAAETNLTNFIIMLIAAAENADASDIHIESTEKNIVVRFRLDGVLHIVAQLPNELWLKIINRVKNIAGLKINVNNLPQDGRITINFEKSKLDIRVSTLPTSFGESIVMRLLKSTGTSISFEELGLRGKALDDLKREISKPNGMIITTGPTGSGKTTTLYAILLKLNNQETKIITLEDPVEYQLEGISQSQIDYDKKYTFPSGLRAILRQDPDIIMVGEIRDLETAETAIQAALTGHLVLSTIHTNDAAGAIPRFLSMGTKPFLLSPALNAVIGQRLCRKICEFCKEETALDEITLEKVKKTLSEISPAAKVKIDLNKIKFYRGAGCPKCNHLGYKGRIGIYEIFSMCKEIETVILSGEVSEYSMREIAVKLGMITMVQDGLLKALEGITTVDEVYRVAD